MELYSFGEEFAADPDHEALRPYLDELDEYRRSVFMRASYEVRNREPDFRGRLALYEKLFHKVRDAKEESVLRVAMDFACGVHRLFDAGEDTAMD